MNEIWLIIGGYEQMNGDLMLLVVLQG